MAQTAVDIVVKVAGGQKLKQLDTALKGTAANAVKASSGLDRSAVSAKKAGQAASQAQGGFKRLASAVKGAAVAIAGFQIGKQIAQVGIDSIEAERRLNALAGTFGEVQAAQQAATKIADKFGLSQREAAKGFAQIYARLRPIGISLADIESAYAGFETSARLSGASAQESSAAFLQLSQALGSGVLRGEELNSVFEQTPGVVKAIADEMNVPIGKIRELAKEGEITSDIVLRALKRLEREGVAGLATAMNGPRQKFKDFSNSVEKLSNALATTVLPDLADAISEVGDAILLLEGPIKFISGLLKNALSEVNQLIREITKAPAAAAAADLRRGGTGQNLVNALTFRDPNEGLKQLFGEEGLKDLKRQAEDYAKLRNQSVKEVFSALALDRLNALDGDGYIKSVDNTLKPTTKLDRDKDKVKTKTGGVGRESKVPELQRELALAKQLEPLYGRIAEAQLRGDEETAIRLQGQVALLELKKEEADVLASSASPAEKLLEIEKIGFALRKQVLDTTYELKELQQQQKEALEGVIPPIEQEIELLEAKLNGNEKYIQQLQEIEALAKSIAQARGASVPTADDTSKATGLIQQRDEIKAQVEEFERMQDMVKQISGTIATEFTNAISSVVQGTKSIDAAFSEMLQNIGKSFIEMAMKIIQQQIQMIIYGTLMKALGVGMPGAGLGGSGGGFGVQPLTSGLDFSSAFAGGFAQGGIIPPNRTALVGENGPELVQTSGSPMQVASAPQTNQMMQSAMSTYSPANSFDGGPANQTIRFESTVINGVEYVTREEAEAIGNRAARTGAQQGAKLGEQRSMNRLRQSRSTRSQLGF